MFINKHFTLFGAKTDYTFQNGILRDSAINLDTVI